MIKLPMQPTTALTPPTKLPQQRLRRFRRQPEKLEGRQLTDKGLEVMAAIERYRFVPSSLLVRLASGGQRNNYRHLQTLFHKGFVNRFALPTIYGMPGEFVYYLDTQPSFHLLVQRGLIQTTEADRKRREELIRLNSEKAYHQLHKDPDQQGKLMYIQHELMVSRFHALLELACRKFAGKVELEQWKQGSEIYGRVEVPMAKKLPDADHWQEFTTLEKLPHRPDAFFTLYFPSNPPDKQRSHFLYEADRGTENTSRYKIKLRAHWHFIVKHQLQRQAPYSVHAIRAVLTESLTNRWAQNLREAARHPIVSGKASPLFWFTSSELLTKPTPNGARSIPLYLKEPETIFKRIWANPSEEKFFSLLD